VEEEHPDHEKSNLNETRLDSENENTPDVRSAKRYPSATNTVKRVATAGSVILRKTR